MKHRPDIDGLRTLAIVPVVLFHVDIPLFSGGFTGVDIFFVISGFLITSLIIEDIRRDRFSILAFYKRRALRILPAYVALILFVMAASYFVLLPDETRNLGRSVMAASAFVSNIYFWTKTGYFETGTESELLLHSWTLSVEEQYYLLLPIFLVLVARYLDRRYVAAIALVSIGSFVISVWGLATGRDAATFYLLPTRAWEFGLGSLAAATAARDTILDARMRQIGVGLGAALIGYGVFGLDSASTFPGPNAIFPAMGALLLIVCAEGTSAGRILSLAPFVAIGKISYSLYLWHWPIIVLYKAWFGPVLESLDAAAIIVVSTGLAAASYRWVEQPFRAPAVRARPSLQVNGLAVSSLGATVALGLALLIGADAWGGHSAEVRRIADYIDYRARLEVHHCMIHAGREGGYDAFDPETCLAPSNGPPTLLVLGDSHAEHLMPAFERRFSDFNVQSAGATGCTPTVDVEGGHYCPRLIRYVLDEHIPEGGVDIVVLSARWEKDDIEPLLATTAYLSEHVDRIVILGPTPEYLDSFPRILARHPASGAEELRSFLDDEVRALDRRMKEIEWGEQIRYVSLYQLICADGCRVFTRNGEPYLADYGHYTRTAADEIASDIKEMGIARPP